MAQNKSSKPVLIYDEGGIQTFRDPDTGKEFSTTVSKPIEGIERNSGLVALRCFIPADSEVAKRLADLRSIVGSSTDLDNRQMLSEVRNKGTVTITGLRRWRADQIVSELKNLDIAVDVIDE